jgi:S-adenosyl-L-methionine hydrolase (adenosine-forming)
MPSGEISCPRLTRAWHRSSVHLMGEPRIVTFTTDFGLQDPFVGIMHGVVLNIEAATRIVDISHAVPSFNVLDGAFTIAQSYRFFPQRTVHVVVVDPGVGSERRPILAETENFIFIAPDNGVLSLVEQREARFTVRHITAERYFLQLVSQTFHGRDIFAPVAGWLSKGVAPTEFGPEITDYVRLPLPAVECHKDGRVCGSVIKVDKFGNLITNFTALDLPLPFSMSPERSKIIVAGNVVSRECRSYAEGEPGELFAIFGSSEYLEIALKQASAAEKLRVQAGEPVIIVTG